MLIEDGIYNAAGEIEITIDMLIYVDDEGGD